VRYFWYYRRHEDFPPDAHRQPLDPPGAERLCVHCTQTNLPASAQRRLIAAWCDRLPALDVRYLWFVSKVPQVLFEAVCRMPRLEALWIKWSSITSLANLPRLNALRYFHLGSSPRVTSIEPLQQMTGLRWLGRENLGRIRDLAALAGLTQLEGLSLEGSMWTTRRVRDLRPIGFLTELRYLNLANLRADDLTLAPLFSLRQLEFLAVADWWDASERAEIRRRNPRLAA